MPIDPITSSLAGIASPTTGGAAGAAKGGDSFGKSLVDAVQSLDRIQQEADSTSGQLAAGEPIDLHEVMIAQDKASLGMQFAVQVRNKMVEAYQEVMRMQV
jgi:flagellar hook-basal body complex protein FliE